MSEPSREVSEQMNEVAAYLRSRGLGEQIDFYITGRFPEEVPSSEHIGMREHADGYKVWYRDMGTKRVLLDTEDFEEARRVFVDEALKLGRERGRKISRERA